jgi:3'(2'), 5'-bisphosphate nucleotidase
LICPVEPRDHTIAASVATAAGDLLLRVRASGKVGDELKAAADRASNEYILDRLRVSFPDDDVLSEEAVRVTHRGPSGRLWIVDPLDGTREFSEPPRTDWAVHVALTIDGVAHAGAVALPARGLTLSTATVPSPAPRPDRPLRLLVSRTRPPAHAITLAEQLGGELVAMGSAGAKTMAVVLGEADVYAHAGGQYEWDSAAPVAVATAAGLHASRLDGSPLRYGQANPWLPDLLICRPELAPRVIAICREVAVS